MSNKNIFKNVLPAFVVLALGLGGAYFAYDSSFSNNDAASVLTIEPAAGTEIGDEIGSNMDVISEEIQMIYMDQDTSAADALQAIEPSAGDVMDEVDVEIEEINVNELETEADLDAVSNEITDAIEKSAE